MFMWVTPPKKRRGWLASEGPDAQHQPIPHLRDQDELTSSLRLADSHPMDKMIRGLGADRSGFDVTPRSQLWWLRARTHLWSVSQLYAFSAVQAGDGAREADRRLRHVPVSDLTPVGAQLLMEYFVR
jgi:hypothetical protein